MDCCADGDGFFCDDAGVVGRGAFSAGPIGLVAAGPISELVGARTVLAFGAAWSLTSSLLVLALPTTRKVHWMTSDDEPAVKPDAMAG